MTDISQGIMILVAFPPTSREQAQRYAERAAALVHEEFGRHGHHVRYEPVKGKVGPTDKSLLTALERDAVAKLGGRNGYLPPLRETDAAEPLPTVVASAPADLTQPPRLRNNRVLRLADMSLLLTDREARALIALRRESGRARRWVSTETLYAAAYSYLPQAASEARRRALIGGLMRRIRERYPNLHLIESRKGRTGGYRWMADRFDLHEE